MPACWLATGGAGARKKWRFARICQKGESVFAAAISIPRAAGSKWPCRSRRARGPSSCRSASYSLKRLRRRDFSATAPRTSSRPSTEPTESYRDADGLVPFQLFLPNCFFAHDARQRERYLKTGRGGRYLKQRLASWLSEIRSNKLERH